MTDALSLSWLMLPLGAVLGWYWARRAVPAGGSRPSGASDYLSGLSHLVNEDADQAAAALVRAIEADPSSVELHFTLGNLFRKRGEIDRALRLHQNLLALPNLDRVHYNQARFELAQDYQRAGVMDRAETLLQELAAEGLFLQPALEQMLVIEEQAREWAKAIETARRLEAIKGQSLRPTIAHYLCELAEQAATPADALRCADEALATDPACVRASVVQGRLHEKSGDLAAAIKAYRRVPEQDLRFIGEVLVPMQRCHEQRHDLAAYWTIIEDLEQRVPHPAVMRAKARLMTGEGVDPTAYLTAQLQQRPDWQGLDLLLQAVAERSAALAPALHGLQGALRATSATLAPYRCGHCGLSPRTLFWQCPGCKQWGSVAPATV